MTVWHRYAYLAFVFPPGVAASGADGDEASFAEFLEDLLCRFITNHES